MNERAHAVMFNSKRAWIQELWACVYFRGNPLSLPASVGLLVALLLGYGGLSALQAWLLLKQWPLVAAAAAIDTGFTLLFFGFFVAVRAPKQWLLTMVGVIGLGVIYSVPQIALGLLHLDATPLASLPAILALALLIASGLALARVLSLCAGFKRGFALVMVLTYFLADDRLVNALTGVSR
jgi:hypothetical protein